MKTASARPDFPEPAGKVTPASSRCAPPENWQDACFTLPHRAGLAFMAVCFAVAFLVSSPLYAQNTHRAALIRASSQYFSAVDSPSLSITGDLTIEAWVKPASQPPSGGHFGIVDKAPGSFFFMYTADLGGPSGLVFSSSADGLNQTGASSVRTLATNQWHHVAAVKQAGTVTFYVNGNSIGSGPATASIFDNTSEVRIGSRIGTVGNFDGSIDEVRVWAVARTEGQIRTAMFAELNGSESGLRGYWKLNNSLADSSPSGNTLAPVNVPAFASNDLPFATSANQLEWCVDKDTKGLFHLNGDGISAIPGTTLTNTGGVNFGAGKFSSGADFGANNTTKSLSTTDPLGIDGGPITLSCWVKLNTEIGAGTYTFLDQANNTSRVNYVIEYEFNGGSRRINFLRQKPGVATQLVQNNITLGITSFHFLTLTYDGATLAGYVDGIPVGTLAASGNGVQAGVAGIGVGIRNFTGSARASAVIDEVLVSSRAMSTEEVMKYYGGMVSARFASLPGDGAVLNISGTNWATMRNGASGNSVYAGDTATQGGIAGNRGNSGADFVERGFFPS